MGRLSDAQQEIVAEYVRGQRVHDLGAGLLGLSRQLLALGAEHVVAVDKCVASPPVVYPGLTIVESRFDDYTEASGVVFVSWPVNWPMGLHILLERSPLVIYLGSNVNGSACGYPRMWIGLATRDVLAHVPEAKNTLIVYGERRVQRDLLLEERAALDPSELYVL